MLLEEIALALRFPQSAWADISTNQLPRFLRVHFSPICVSKPLSKRAIVTFPLPARNITAIIYL
jgi:hypothetical protein